MTARGAHALVTGGAGFIGHHLVRELLARGLDVTVLDNLSTGDPARLPGGARLVEGDVRDPDALSRALDGVSHVFHLAAVVTVRGSVDRFVEDADVNLLGTLQLLRAMEGRRIETATLASSMAVYGPCPDGEKLHESMCPAPIAPYGVSKLAAEKYWMLVAPRTGAATTVLRYFNTYGPGQSVSPYVGVITYFINLLRAGKAPTIFGDGLQRRDFVHVQDIVRATASTMGGGGHLRALNVGTGHGTTVLEIAEQLIAWIEPDIRPVFEPEREGELREAIADISAASEALGYAPSVPTPDLSDVIDAPARG